MRMVRFQPYSELRPYVTSGLGGQIGFTEEVEGGEYSSVSVMQMISPGLILKLLGCAA